MPESAVPAYITSLIRHFADLRDGTHGGSASRKDKEAHFEREFKGLQKFEPISRSHDGFVDILQLGRNDPAGYFYYVMELADDANAECGTRNAESALTRPADTLSHPTRRAVAPSQRRRRGRDPRCG